MSDQNAPADEIGIVDRLSSAVRSGVFYLWSAPNILAIIAAVSLRPDDDLWYRLLRGWARFGLGVFGVDVTVRGLDKLEPGHDYVVLANHRSHFDVFAVIHAFSDRETKWVAKRELEKVPLFGWALRATGQIIVDRSNHEQAIRELRKNLGTHGATIMFFPEGSRAPTSELLPFKRGGAAFALDARLPVVPLAISGSERVLRTHSLTVRPGTIELIFGDPIPIDSLGPDDRAELTARARDAIESMLGPVEGGSHAVHQEAPVHA